MQLLILDVDFEMDDECFLSDTVSTSPVSGFFSRKYSFSIVVCKKAQNYFKSSIISIRTSALDYV